MRTVASGLRILSQSTRALPLNPGPSARIASRRIPRAVAHSHFVAAIPSSIRKFGAMSDSAAEEPQAAATAAQPTGQAAPAQPELPPLTPAEFKIYNHMAEKMEYFHNYFRHEWTLLHDAATSGRRPRNMTLKQFLEAGLEFARHLTGHHNIEEVHVFPMLAERMPEFRGGRAELLRQHKEIHKGLDVFEAYLHSCLNRETELELGVLREKMDGWGAVLWTHLDQEVATLGAENMRRYWTKEEMGRMRM
ncbi:hypothetical protein CGRA01v4_06605 [Colletotrichum graminicola]|nr:hypothetical protein CGRA01v4_06605 [Colletotrichum graminicola]